MTGNRTDIADACLCRFFHHIAQLACEKEFSFSRHQVYFNLKGISSHTGPCQSPDNTHFICLVFLLISISGSPQKVFQIFRGHSNLFFLIFHDFPGRFSADIPDLSFQVPDSGLLCIASNNLPESILFYPQLLFLQAMGLDLFRDQMFPGNMPLFIFCITADFNDLHPIQQRSGDRLKVICRGDKENLRQIQGDLHIIISEFYILF